MVKNDAFFEIQQLPIKLDGVFGVIILDMLNDIVTVLRDPIGVRSLYIGFDKARFHTFGVASEMKALTELCDTVHQFDTGTIMQFSFQSMCPILTMRYAHYKFVIPQELEDKTDKDEDGGDDNDKDKADDENNKAIISKEKEKENEEFSMEGDNFVKEKIMCRDFIIAAVIKRKLSDRPMACLLSGGVDSSIVCSILAKKCFDNPANLHTFSIGLPGSTDLMYARKVANYLGTTHHEFVFDKEDFIESIPSTIKRIESYDVTTVRASVPMFLLAKQIKLMDDLDIAVVFSGEGSDEACGSYLYFHNAPNPEDFNDECHRLLANLHHFDCLRCEKCLSGAGLEARVPFLDRNFLSYYLELPIRLRMPYRKIEKFLLRSAFSGWLPDEVLWRRKEAFSDGVNSLDGDPWFKRDDEKEYYLSIFKEFYPGREDIIPEYWMPRWCGDQTDPSAWKLKNELKLDDKVSES